MTTDKTIKSKYQPKQTNVTWVDLSSETPVEKHFINGRWVAVSGGGGGTSDYTDLENKPFINGVELSGNKTSSDLGVATSQQGAKADTAYQKPTTGIPESDLSSDVQQALQKHFKGWYNTLAELKAAHTAVEGDSAYVKDASPATTWSIYVYDATATTDNNWADSGTDADTSNVQTFASNQEVNEVHIVNDLTTGGVDDVLSAEQGKQLDAKKQDANPIRMIPITETEIINGYNSESGFTSNSNYRTAKYPVEQGKTYRIRGKCGATFSSYLYALYNGTTWLGSYSNTHDNTVRDMDIEIPSEGTITHIYVTFYAKTFGGYCKEYGDVYNLQEQVEKNTRDIADVAFYTGQTVKTVNIVDSLDSNDGDTSVLSAKQGKVINANIDPPVYTVNSLFKDDFAEVYITSPLINTIENVILRHYNKLIFKGLPNNIFTCSLKDSDYSKNGVAYELKVDSTNDETNYPIGTRIGYVVFKDITHFKNTNSGNDTYYIDLNRATNIRCNPLSSQQYTLDLVADKIIEGDLPTYLNGVTVNLPDEIVVSKGDRLQVFWRNVVTAFNPYVFDVIGVCNVGYSFPRYFEFTPTDDIVDGTTYTLTVYVRNNKAETIDSKSTTIKVVDRITNPSANKNILLVGASSVASGNIIYELNRRLKSSNGYEYKWTFAAMPSVAVGDVYTVANGYKYEVTEIGADFIGVIKTADGTGSIDTKTLTKDSGDAGSPETIMLKKYVSSYNVTYEKPHGLGLTNITFVGSKTPSSYPALYQEATGGWSWSNYTTAGRQAYRFYVTGQSGLSQDAVYSGDGTLKFTIKEINTEDGTGNISCTFSGSGTQPASGTLTKYSGDGPGTITYDSYSLNSANPFWNDTTQELDFQNYADNVIDVDSIDVVITHMGLNDIFNGRTLADIRESIELFIDTLHEQYPSAIVILSSIPLSSPYGGMTSNYGAKDNNSYWSKALQVGKLAQLYNDIANDEDYNSFVQLSTPFHTFDAEHLYPTKMVTVDNRCAETEVIQTNGVHPIDSGGYTVADDIFRSIMKMLG